MASTVADWMCSQRLEIKREFVTPWGVCDLAGVAFRRANVRHRIRLGQRHAIGSVLKTSILMSIPDVESAEHTTLGRVRRQWEGAIDEGSVEEAISWLIEYGYVVAGERGRLQKKNGWVPLHRRIVAIELKLDRISEVFCQARSNLGFADESYIAVPEEIANRIKSQPSRWEDYLQDGIGLIAVNHTGCRTLIRSRANGSHADPAIQSYCVEKFWRTRTTDS